ncbi:hypothetical protein ACFOGJ_06385 [Marinibaculum pumilum]|uniref:4-(hydroxymethyl)-2-furancarboxaldehyde-phosphate synthase n=1 Tax=Marinibaculum pumilum TaxID=1766165 RepID=A0ABV7KXY2_9PROT
MSRPPRRSADSVDLARAVRRLTDVELTDGDAVRDAVNALVARHVTGNMPPAALAVAPEAFDHLLAALPAQPGQPDPVLRTVTLTGGALAVDLEAALGSLEKGADEVQLDLEAEAFLPDERDQDPAFTLLRDLKLACGPHVPLKVMLRDRAFADDRALAEAVEIALSGGADMIGLDLAALGIRGADAALDATLRLTGLLRDADRPVGIKLRGGTDILAGLAEADTVLRLARRFQDREAVGPDRLRLCGAALDDAVLTCLRAAGDGPH